MLHSLLKSCDEHFVDRSSCLISTSAVVSEKLDVPRYTSESPGGTLAPAAARKLLQEASEATDNTTFLRGTVQTDANGVAVLQTIVPGWYSGKLRPDLLISSQAASCRVLSKRLACWQRKI